LHDLNLATMFCDRIVVLSAGRVVGEGTPAETITESMIGDVFGVQARIVDDDGVWVRVDRRG